MPSGIVTGQCGNATGQCGNATGPCGPALRPGLAVRHRDRAGDRAIGVGLLRGEWRTECGAGLGAVQGSA